MIIIEVAIGIVLAVLILKFLPELISFGGILILIIFALVLGGLLLYWLGSNPAVLGFVVLVAIGIVLYALWKKRIASASLVEDLREHIRCRNSLGYDTTDLEYKLSTAIGSAAQESGARSKKSNRLKSRRELGYTDDENKT